MPTPPWMLIKIPKTSDFPPRSQWEIVTWDIVIAHLTALQKPKDMKLLFELFMTPHERSLFLRRIAAANRILEGQHYRAIGEELWLTPQTISAIKKALQNKHYKSYYERGKTERKKKVYSPPPKSLERKNPFLRKRRTKFGTITSY